MTAVPHGFLVVKRLLNRKVQKPSFFFMDPSFSFIIPFNRRFFYRFPLLLC